jgi:hypothetical protein
LIYLSFYNALTLPSQLQNQSILSENATLICGTPREPVTLEGRALMDRLMRRGRGGMELDCSYASIWRRGKWRVAAVLFAIRCERKIAGSGA